MKNPPLLLLRAIRRAQRSGVTSDLIQPGAGAQLPGPIFSLALKHGDVLDPTDLSAGGMTVKVVVDSLLYVGGKARLHWEGYSINPPLELPIAALGELNFWVDKARYVDPNLDGSVHVWYELIPPTGAIGVSESLLISVQDATSQTWPAPEVHDHTGSPVNLWSPIRPGTTQTNIAHFVLRDARLKVNDAVAPLWLFSDGASLGVDMIFVTTVGEVRAEIPAAVLAESLSKTVQVSYLPILAGVPGSLSEALNLQVLTFTSGQLVTPTIVEAVLDLNRFAGDATLLTTPWPLIGLGQIYWLHANATLDDGTQRIETLANAQAVNADQVSAGLRIRLSRGFLLRLENATQLTLQLKVAFAATTAEGEAIMFPESDVNVVQLALTLPVPTVTGVEDGRLDPADIPAEGVKITAAYTGQAVGQWVSAHWVGVTAALSHDFPAVQVTNANTPLEFMVPRAKAEESLFKAVSVVYTVARTQGAEAKTSLALPFELEGTAADFIETFDSVPVETLTVHSTSNVVVKKIEGHPRSEQVAPSPPWMSGTYYNADRSYPLIIEIKLKFVGKRIKIGLQAEHRNPIEFMFYNSANHAIGTASIVAPSYSSGIWLEYDHPDGREIVAFTMSSAKGFAFDNLTVS